MASGVQVHDFNPGIAPNGLFWTVMIPDGGVQVNFGAGRASMNVTDLGPEQGLMDYITLPNGLIGQTGGGFSIPPVPASVSFAMQWSGVTSRLDDVVNTTDRFTGNYVLTTATMQWSASTAEGFTFTSDNNPTSSLYALLGHEQNGVFFGA